MSRILDDAGRELIGYTGAWSAKPGGRVELMVSTTEPSFDVTYLPYPAGGAVFSVGACSWCWSLSTTGSDRDVSRLTGNGLRRFVF